MTNNLDESEDSAEQVFLNWVEEQVRFDDPHQITRPNTLFANYRRWALRSGKPAASPEQFVALLVEHLSVRRFGGRVFIGCGLREAPPPKRHERVLRRIRL
jgi:hypothetical protein